MRLGLQVFATDTGLGTQTRALYKHLKPAKTMLVDLSQYNHMPVHDDWYDVNVRTLGFPTNAEIDNFLDGLDVVMICETPLNYYLFSRARERGIRTVLQYNYEFLDYLTAGEERRQNLPLPDMLAAPTDWNIDHVRSTVGHRAEVSELPVPVDTDELPQRTIAHARRFFHIAGRSAVYDRNGTLNFIAAAKLAAPTMPGAEFILFMQQPNDDIKLALANAPMIRRVWNVLHPSDMYQEGDILVLPRRYGGLCLPAQEAVGCGIPVLMTDISPNNTWLPADWLVPIKSGIQQFQARCPIDVYSVDLGALADRMVALYNDDVAVVAMHEQAKQMATQMSWEALMPRYQKVLGLKELVA